jgi:hypothetical protein
MGMNGQHHAPAMSRNMILGKSSSGMEGVRRGPPKAVRHHGEEKEGEEVLLATKQCYKMSDSVSVVIVMLPNEFSLMYYLPRYR